jgi:GNAT superfamily N-acetyltransferase
MPSMQIREADLERDVPALVALLREVSPLYPITEAALRRRYAAVPARARRRLLVAEAGGEVVGRADASLDFMTNDGKARFSLAVRESHRARGIGAELYEAAIGHIAALAANRVVTDFLENAAGVRFALARGLHESRAETLSVLDPRAVSEEPPAGIELRPVGEVDPHVVHRVDEATTRDVPFDGTVDEIPYDEWLAHVLDNPLFAAEGSFVAFVDGEPAALSLLLADRATGSGANMFTGTLRAVKLATTRWAAANGLTHLVTNNDERNAAMLAVNRRLGYVPAGRRVEYGRDL